MKKEIRKHVLSIIFVSIFLVLSTTFIYLPNRINLVSALAFLSNEQSFYMEDISEGVLLKDAYPMKDDEGLKTEPYTFRVVNNSKKNITYKIIFKNNEEKAKSSGKQVLDNKYLRYSISDESNNNIEVKTLSDNSVLLETTITPGSKQVFNFRMWLDYDADEGAMDKIFIGTREVQEVK